ncbi:hypothetical protein HanXRQr2_Chr05g0235521 [Helianthus annuus]|uniref:Uncharacterized protein n=1 Tax=Helianthus annuus TaxID=4232 RepID=A0A9K3NPX0_HELAN|nr:hypothetical protein HanXRQr2_Chr05g0235521 [Helianthus annuus]
MCIWYRVPVPNFPYRIGTHFLSFSVPVPVRYDTGSLSDFAFKYRYRSVPYCTFLERISVPVFSVPVPN